jgi:hypothetical protein
LTGQQVVTWLTTVTTAARAVLGTNNKFISHAPQSPYFGPIGGGSTWWPGSTGGYSGIYQNAASAIDWFNVQFYNQGSTCYTTEAGLFTSSVSDCSVFPGTSVAEIVAYGIPASKIVVGKYDTATQGSNGYVSAANLAPWLVRYPNGGLMIWQWMNLNQITLYVQTAFSGTLAPTISLAPTRAPSTGVPTISIAPTRTPTTGVPTTSVAPTRAPTSAPAGGSGVSACVDVGQSALCSTACADSCRGFAPYYSPGCLAAATCANPPLNARGSLCDCTTRTPTSTSMPTVASSSNTPTAAPQGGTSVAPSQGVAARTNAPSPDINAATVHSALVSCFLCLVMTVMLF